MTLHHALPLNRDDTRVVAAVDVGRDEVPGDERTLGLRGFLDELHALGAELRGDRRPEDVAHFRRIVVAGRLLFAVGLATAWWGLNPLSVLAMAIGASARWMIVAHHVVHGAFDGHADAPQRWSSRTFARGLRRFVDWADWLPPRAWAIEHNILHHYRLGEDHDPDEPVGNFAWLRALRLPRPLATVLVFVAAAVWRPIYYGPNTVRQTLRRRAGLPPAPFAPLAAETWLPTSELGRAVWSQVWLPTLLLRFVLLPALFLPLGTGAALAVLANLLVADVVTNLHTFAVIVPNHAGDDILRFDGKPRDADELALRQILGTANYRTGGAVNDFLHGYLNYQIEHHLWPDLAPAQLARAQPRVEELCRRHGVPYVQQPLSRRLLALVRNVLGDTKARRSTSAVDEIARAG